MNDTDLTEYNECMALYKQYLTIFKTSRMVGSDVFYVCAMAYWDRAQWIVRGRP